MRLLRTLDASQIRMVVDQLCTFHSLGRDRMLLLITARDISASGLKRRQSFDDAFLQDLWAFIQASDPPIKAAIIGYIGTVSGQARGRLATSLSWWITQHEVASETFAKACTNERGHYLLLRSPAPGQLELALMTVTFAPDNELIPRFETQFYKDGSPYHTVLGNLFQVGNSVYAVGKTKDNPGLRYSKMRKFTRPSGATDLYGIRLAQSFEVRRPFAHYIYGYQLLKPRSPETIQKLLAVTHFDDPLLNAEIDHVPEIKQLLATSTFEEGGLIAKPFGDP